MCRPALLDPPKPPDRERDHPVVNERAAFVYQLASSYRYWERERSNLAIPWSDDYASLLELAEAYDVPHPVVRTGVCHNSESTLIGGTVDYNPEPVEPPAEGSLLICCSRPHDDVVLDL